MFALLFLPFSIWIAVTAMNKGPRIALWQGWLVALLFAPVWLVKGLGSVTLDFRTGAAVIGLGALLLSEKESIRYRFAIMDVLVFSLFMTHLISGFGAGEMSAMTIPEIMRRWLMPYIVGRVFLNSIDDLPAFLPVVARILLALSILSAFEAITKINPMCKALGKSYPILDAGEGYRWGIKRAQGPLDHPIFFGLTLVMAYPLAAEAGRRAVKKIGPKWWLALPATVFGAVFFTASRGPIIAAFVTLCATVTFSLPKLRNVLLIVGIVGGIVVVQAKDHVKEALSAAVESDEFERYVEIEGKEYRYTGTAHRELLMLVYREAIDRCPPFGYGSRLRGVPIAEHLAQRFSSIDNHYLLFYLQRGSIGLTLFISITLLALGYLLWIAFQSRLPHSSMAGAMVGALLGVSSLLMTVWFAPDHGAVWLFFVGFATCLRHLDVTNLNEGHNPTAKTEEKSGPKARISLIPGHAPIRHVPSPRAHVRAGHDDHAAAGVKS